MRDYTVTWPALYPKILTVSSSQFGIGVVKVDRFLAFKSQNLCKGLTHRRDIILDLGFLQPCCDHSEEKAQLSILTYYLLPSFSDFSVDCDP